MNKIAVSTLIIALLALAGCASERVVLLPSADGRPSAVVIRDAQGEVVLDKPYAATVRRQDSNSPYVATLEEVKERFGAALAAQPVRPNNYVLYFEAGGNVLTAQSALDFERSKKEIAERPAPEIRVVGHTDRVGNAEANDNLSKKRADAIRTLLIESGVQADRIESVGRGEGDPLVPTADDVDEPKNRRVEINLR